MAEMNKNNLDHLNSSRQEEEVRDLFCSLVKQDNRDHVCEEEVSAKDRVTAEALKQKDDEPSWPLSQEVDAIILTDHENVEEMEDEDDVSTQEIYGDMPLILTSSDDEDEEDEDDKYIDETEFIVPQEEVVEIPVIPQGARTKKNPFSILWHELCDNVPLPGDSVGEILRKTMFWLSWVIITGALSYILYHVWWQPAFTKELYQNIKEEYRPEISGTVEDGQYPAGMQLSFQSLYDRNPEIRGWLSYHAVGNRDFLNIEYPIVYSGDNVKYLTTDFNGNANKSGALFFDQRSKLQSPEDTNTSLIVYGHNMASGQMLAGLNRFIGNVNNARTAATLTMNTLFSNGEYKVFAVVLTDEKALNKYYYNVRRTAFAGEEDFNNYIKELQDRSLFDYPVDVQAGDELLLLSTCTAPSTAKVESGRLTVVARKVRVGEAPAVDTSKILKNEDVIMPYAWYTAQKLDTHAYYDAVDAMISKNPFKNWQSIVSYLASSRSTTTTVSAEATSITETTMTKLTTARRTLHLTTTTKVAPETTTTSIVSTAAPTTSTTVKTETTAAVTSMVQTTAAVTSTEQTTPPTSALTTVQTTTQTAASTTQQTTEQTTTQTTVTTSATAEQTTAAQTTTETLVPTTETAQAQ